MHDWGAPPWRVTYEPPPAGALPSRCRVAVVGAGLTGLSAAWHLAARGLAPVVLEAGRIGAGASGHTGALALEGTAQGPLPGADHCLDTVRDVVATLGVDCALDLPGCDLLEHRDDAGAACWRDGGQPLCVTGVEAGGTLDVGALLSALARAAVGAGAAIHQGTCVTAIAPGRLDTSRGPLAVEHVVVAVNAWSATLLRLPVRLGVALTLAVATAPLPPAVREAIGLAHGRPFYTLDLPYLWGRRLETGAVTFGAGLVFAGDGRPESVDCRHPETLAAFARLEARVRGLHPALADVAIPARWGGPIAFAQRPPFLGAHPEMPGVWVAGAYAGHGVVLGVHAGRLLAAAIADGAPLPAWGAVESPDAG